MIIQHFQTPSAQQMLATAQRLGANATGSAFEAISLMGFNRWIDAADQEYCLTVHNIESNMLSDEEFELRRLYLRRATLPVFS